MSYSLLAFSAIALLLLLLLAWLSFGKRRVNPEMSAAARPERDWRHVSYAPYVNQALMGDDMEFISTRGSPELAKRFEKERRQIALKYLRALRSDFEKLVDFARVVAVMSPDVELVQELQGLRLQLAFRVHYYLIYTRLYLGIAPSTALGNLSNTVRALAIRMEAAISDLGERAALGDEFSSYTNGGVS
jgi:hypothetical protein